MLQDLLFYYAEDVHEKLSMIYGSVLTENHAKRKVNKCINAIQLVQEARSFCFVDIASSVC